MNDNVFLTISMLVYLFIGLGVFFVLKIIFALKGDDDDESFGNAIMIALGWPFVIAFLIIGAPFWCVSKAADVIIKSLKEQKGENTDD